MPLPKGIISAADISFKIGGWKYAIFFLILYLAATGYQVNIMCTVIPDEFLIATMIAICAAAIVGGIVMGAINWSKHIGDSGERKKLAVKHVATAAIGVIVAGACGYVLAPVGIAKTYAENAGTFEWIVISVIITFAFALFWVYIFQGGFSAIKNIGDASVKLVEVVKETGDKVFKSKEEFLAWWATASKKEKAAYLEAEKDKEEAEAAAAKFADPEPVIENAPKDEGSA